MKCRYLNITGVMLFYFEQKHVKHNIASVKIEVVITYMTTLTYLSTT